ncbi:hypothetical protein B0T17DRAFT_615233 [Bombardia bombarda]|uniref:NACHT domain-containing protein n=1 Tax=Bombardia bombarda TaxID=252184 RepID=A0AA40C912_9PEZI|nr:hypothetical protein B0T17DRAFT_615233 [Bombardia bombarda]
MDPLSVSLGIAGILPLVAKAIISAKAYTNAVLSAKDSIATLVNELEALQLNVSSLLELLKGDAVDNSNLKFHQTSVLLSCSSACQAKLLALCNKLSQQDNSNARRFLWPFTEKEHQKSIQELRNFSNWMQLALSVDGCRLLSRTSDDVVKVMSQQLHQFQVVQSVQEDTRQILRAVQGQKQIIQDAQERDSRKHILDWISTAGPSQRHQTLQESRAKDTGVWILRRDKYTTWLEPQRDESILWCHGIQGSGKTNLASIIIDDLLGSVASPESPVAFFYFDHQEQSEQTPSAVWSCILRQLLEHLPRIPESVSSIYQNRRSGESLSLFETERLLTELIKPLKCAYLVIDALDECSPEHRGGFLQVLGHLSEHRNFRLLATSRPHIQDIINSLQRHPQLAITAHEEDIRLYLHQELNQKNAADVADDEFLDRLVQKLSEGADGMFLLPVLQLRTILKEPTLGEMEDRLENLSHGLDEAFAETVTRIQSLPESRRRLGMGALMYLTYAVRPMTVHELSDALAFRPGQTCVKAKYRPSGKVILECCQGLVAIDAETAHVRVAHYAIQEYLVEHSNALFPQAEAKIATNCMRYLLLEDFKSGPWEADDEIDSVRAAFPFLSYAASYWGRHTRPHEMQPDVWSALSDLFTSAPAMAIANQIRQYSVNYRQIYYSAEESRSFTPLHHASRHGLLNMAVACLDSGRFDVNLATVMGATPIIQMAASGHLAGVRMLLERGADPYLSNWYGNALHCAVEGNKADTTRELIVWGMDPNDAAIADRPYLGCALDCDSAASLEALVDLGADMYPAVSEVDRQYRDPDEGEHLFFEACRSGCINIVSLMLDRRWADANMRSKSGRTAMHWAVVGYNLAVLRRLVDAGADINAPDMDGLTPLEFAIQGNRVAAIKYLASLAEVVENRGPLDKTLQSTPYESKLRYSFSEQAVVFDVTPIRLAHDLT